ncbi:MAG TPA: DNA-processing protein DprA [Burkholderiales bacterium]|nr:DNA-processing protein DprA [Burkholderiales bacterium]
MGLDPHLEPWLRLSFVPGLGDESLRRLLVSFGSPEAILAAAPRDLARIVPHRIAVRIREAPDDDRLKRTAAWLSEPDNTVVTLGDPRYPQSLLQIPDPPPLLYVKGRTERLNGPALSIVGSRHATPHGLKLAESFATALSDAGLTIVSGLALGIDAAAHRGGLSGRSSSIGVVGTGLDIVYPARNRALAHELAASGALISELPLGTKPLAGNFPRRNRLISGLGRGCLVIEAAAQSGSLITARLANEQGREVFAVPGSVHSPLSKGCHRLIKEGAKLVERAQDVLEELRLPFAPAPQTREEAPLKPGAEKLLKDLGYDPCDIDTLIVRSGLGSDELSALLTELEIAGRVAMLPGGKYQRLR